MAKKRWLWPDSEITRVVDGDTLVAGLTRDLGFNGSVRFEQRLRLNRINAAPVGTIAGKAAKHALEELVGWDGNASDLVQIETVGAYKYGDEWMAEITLEDGTNLSDKLVADDQAAYWDGSGPRPGG